MACQINLKQKISRLKCKFIWFDVWHRSQTVKQEYEQEGRVSTNSLNGIRKKLGPLWQRKMAGKIIVVVPCIFHIRPFLIPGYVFLEKFNSVG